MKGEALVLTITEPSARTLAPPRGLELVLLPVVVRPAQCAADDNRSQANTSQAALAHSSLLLHSDYTDAAVYLLGASG